MALKERLIAAKRRNCNQIEVEGDSSLIINCVKGSCAIPWKLKSLIRDVLALANSFVSITFSHTYREANFLADDLALVGHSLSSPMCWFDRIPSQAQMALLMDSSCIGCLRGFSL
ncbi:hypothetical protein ACLB2K_037789 [Fragaria x ananassa]